MAMRATTDPPVIHGQRRRRFLSGAEASEVASMFSIAPVP
jgi:hypothetical protein